MTGQAQRCRRSKRPLDWSHDELSINRDSRPETLPTDERDRRPTEEMD